LAPEGHPPRTTSDLSDINFVSDDRFDNLLAGNRVTKESTGFAMVDSSLRDDSASNVHRPVDPELQSHILWHVQPRLARCSGSGTYSGARRTANGRTCASADHPSDRCANAGSDESSLPSSGSRRTAEPDVIR